MVGVVNYSVFYGDKSKSKNPLKYLPALFDKKYFAIWEFQAIQYQLLLINNYSVF
jgi:glutathione S-transferase